MAQNNRRGDDASRSNAGWNRHYTLNEIVKHSHPLNNHFTLLDKQFNIVTGNLLQRKSMLQMKFIGERMKAQCISNFTDGFQVNKTIWNLVNSLDVMLSVE